jgi:transposase
VGVRVRRTRKWSYVEQEAKRLAALGLSNAEIGRRLDINKSTIGRWVQAGKLTPTRPGAAPRPSAAAKPMQTPAEWAASVRSDYALDATDDQLVVLGQQALEVSIDKTVSPQVRITASGRFQAIARQLALVARGAQAVPPVPEQPQAEIPARRMLPARVGGGDPRGILTAVHG